MSDERVVWQDGGVRITTDGFMQVHCGKDDWRTIDGGMLVMGGTLESLARALAESEAKVARMTRENAKLLAIVKTTYGDNR